MHHMIYTVLRSNIIFSNSIVGKSTPEAHKNRTGLCKFHLIGKKKPMKNIGTDSIVKLLLFCLRRK